MKYNTNTRRFMLTATLTFAVCCGALAQAQLPVSSPYLNGGSMGGHVPIDNLALVDASELLRARGGPIRLTVRAQNATMSEVLTQVSQQSGLPFRIAQYDDIMSRVRVSPAIKDATFWSGMRELLRPVEGGFYRVSSPDGLAVNSGASLLPGRLLEAGPLLLAAERIENQSSLSLDPEVSANPAREARLTLVLNVAFEPRLLAEPGMTHCRVTEARDDTGAALSLVTDEDETDIGTTVSSWNATQLKIPFRGLGSNARQLSVVRGVISVPVWSDTEEWRVEDFQALPQEKIIGGQTFRLEKVGKEKDKDRTEAVITLPGRTQIDSGTTEMSMFDESGRELSSAERGNGQDSEGTRTQRFYFNGTPKTAIVRVRSSMQRIEVPWELRDLPLP